jgi:predicted dehydrogenase
VNVANWFFGAVPEAVHASGGLFRFPEQREVYDHVYATFEYPGGRNAVFSSIESNAFDHFYEMFLGTKGTLILRGETEVYLFDEGQKDKPTGVEVAPKGKGPVLDASESRAADAAGMASSAVPDKVERVASYKNEISEFCASVRVGKPVRCGPDKAIHSAKACIVANDAVEKKTRLSI